MLKPTPSTSQPPCRHMCMMDARRAGSAPEEEKNAGATATIALARRDKIVVANVGDSRAVLSRE